jgi:hypothetical protein
MHVYVLYSMSSDLSNYEQHILNKQQRIMQQFEQVRDRNYTHTQENAMQQIIQCDK